MSKIFAVIPARSGSKGVIGKNLRYIQGRRLYEHSVIQAVTSSTISKVVVSTDDATILKERFMESNIVKYLKRPNNLALDTSPSSDYLKHAIEHEGSGFDYVVILQPTSPLRSAEDIDSLVSLVSKEGADYGVTVCDVPHQFTPGSLLTATDDNWCCSYQDNDVALLDRHMKARFLARNGAAVYVVKISEFMKTGRVTGNQSVYYKMPFINSIDIDTEEELFLVKLIMESK